jgi:hypothetical protein
MEDMDALDASADRVVKLVEQGGRSMNNDLANAPLTNNGCGRLALTVDTEAG